MTKFFSFVFVFLALAIPLEASAACGDGVIDGGDTCDDGNVAAGDGCSAACAVESGFSCTSQASLAITNGSFESDPFAGGGGWTLVSGTTVDWVDGTANSACLAAGDGIRSIDMNGTNKGQIFQDLGTTVGAHYVVTLLGNANCIEQTGDSCSSHCTKRLTITVSDVADATHTAYATSVYDLNGNAGAVDWQPIRFEFDAVSATTRFTFTGSDPSAAGPMVDRVAVPASLCVATTCGNGTVDSGETCDDGNKVAGDGCNASCGVEPGYTCATAGAACTTTCGDGIIAGNETCDYDFVQILGCSDTCQIEPGYSCVLDPFTNVSNCSMTCGNGTLDAGEVCDDGNTNQFDACSNTCRRSPGEACLTDAQCAVGSCPFGHCTGCYDSAAPGAVDYNCTSGGPACDVSGPVPLCVGCLADGDCPTDSMCDITSHACVPKVVGMDAGVDAGIDAGIDAGTSSDAGVDGSTQGDGGAVHVAGASGGACSVGPTSASSVASGVLLVLAAMMHFARRRRRV